AGKADQPERGFGSPSGGNQVVDERLALAALQCVDMHLEPVSAVLERVVLAEVFGGQLALLPDRHEPGIQRERKRCADDEAARFDRRYLVDAPIAKGVRQRVDRRMEGIGPL